MVALERRTFRRFGDDSCSGSSESSMSYFLRLIIKSGTTSLGGEWKSAFSIGMCPKKFQMPSDALLPNRGTGMPVAAS